jgi:uncharacterized protein (TIGR02391 family)
MAKQTQRPPPTPPTISPQEGKRRLEFMRDKAKEMVKAGAVTDEADDTWSNTTLGYIRGTFGSATAHKFTFLGQQAVRMGGGDQRHYETQNAREMQRRTKVLDELIALIEMEAGFAASAQPQTQQFGFWSQLHPDVIHHSKTRYEDGHFADSVEAAFKHLNVKIKEHVFRKANKELDGSSLMKTAFAPNNPIVSLADLSTESGRNIQQGYMEIFAGSITGIRNPKAHANINIDAKRAMHHLFLASLLLQVFDERI